MKNIKGEKSKLGDCNINCAVRKISFFLKHLQELALLFVSDLRRSLMKSVRNKSKICRNVCLVRFHCMVSKTAKRNHFLVTF